MNNKKVLAASIGLALSAVSHQGLTAGFQINEHSANGLGRAFAGQAAKPENATALATNAASLTQFDKFEISFVGNYIDPNIDMDGELTVNLSGTEITMDASEDDIAESAFIPSLFVVYPVNEKWSVGAGLFSNYGLATDYSDSYNALHFADRAEVISVTFNPTVAYQLTDTFSIGLGLSATHAQAEISTSTPQVIYTLTSGLVPGNATLLKLEGDDWGYGWNVGALWQASPATTVGASYRATTKLNLEGDISSDLLAALNQGGSLDLDLAAVGELAVNHEFNEKWSAQVSLNFTQWNVFEKLEANLESGTTLLLKEEHFENTWRLSTGATYVLNDNVTLRAGYAFDQGAVSDEHRSLSIPDTDRHWFTLGGTYQLNESFTIDAGYAYLIGEDATIESENDITVTGLGTVSSELSASQEASVHIFSAQINYHF